VSLIGSLKTEVIHHKGDITGNVKCPFLTCLRDTLPLTAIVLSCHCPQSFFHLVFLQRLAPAGEMPCSTEIFWLYQ